MNEERVFAFREEIDVVRPERNREAHQQNGFDEHDSKFEVRRDTALDPFMISHGMAAPAKTNQGVGEKSRPPDEERGHKPMAEFQNVIDLEAVLGSIRRLP